ncbi:dynamin-binding protein-like protein, partial [Leptotrombidium deliense]
GDLVLGLQPLDANWWNGRVIGSQRVGVFPITLTWKLNKSLLLLGNNNNVSTSHLGFAVVNQDLKAQLENELDLKKGDKVRILKVVDKLYYEGEFNGKVGIFPKAFVKMVEETASNSETSAQSVTSVTPKVEIDYSEFLSPPPYNEVVSLGYSNANAGLELSSYGQALYEFKAEYPNELSFKEGEIIHLIRHVDDKWMEGELNGVIGVFPKSFISIIVDCSAPAELSVDKLFEAYPANTRAHVLYDFNAQIDGDLSVKCGDVITLTRKAINEEWVEAVDSAGNVGLCPQNFLEIINDSSSNIYTNSEQLLAPRNNLIDFSPDDISALLDPQCANSTVDLTTETRKACKKPVRPAPPLPSKIAAPSPPVVRESVPANSKRVESNSTLTNGTNTTTAAEKCSERDYLRDLKICFNTFIKNDKLDMHLRELNLSLGTLFGNLDEVIAVSERLIKKLEEATLCKKFENQLIGKCFINSADEMREAYGHYCRNHDEVAVIWEKIESNQELKTLFQRGLEKIQKETNCFDVPSLLIKPVQRILKYPLLLNELLKCTDDEHDDKRDLEKATNVMTDVAADINEFKRRKDLVFKYRKEENSSFSSKISKLNMHTLKKKSSRFGYRLSSTFGLSNTKDEEFDAEVLKLHSVEKSINVFLKGLTAFMDQLLELVTLTFHISEEIASFYAEKSKQVEVDELRRIDRLILTDFWEEMKVNVEENVISILKQLLSKFQTPNKLIDKRNDKFLDYIASTKRLESNKDVTKQKSLKDENYLTRSNFEAMNKQLMDDLPKFSAAAVQIFRECILAFIRIQKIFTGRTTKEVLPLTDLPLLECSSIASIHDIVETFQVKHNLVIDRMLCDLAIIPKHVFPGVSNSGTASLDRRNSSKTPKSSPGSSSVSFQSLLHSPQSPQQKLFLRNVYQQRVFEVNQDYDAIDVLDLRAKKGDVVGVVKDKDPSGNTNRWFVDNGSAKGFLPCRILQPLAPTQSTESSASNLQKQMSLNQHNTPNGVHTSSQFIRSHSTESTKIVSQVIRHSAPPLPARPESSQPSISHHYEDIPEETISYSNLMEFQSPSKRKSFADNDLAIFDPLTAPEDTPSCHIGHRYEDVPQERYEEVTPDITHTEISEFYYALYPFNPSGENQLSLNRGQVVLVKHKCDLNGNDDWWFVEDRYGNSGYVPKNYVAMLKTSS